MPTAFRRRYAEGEIARFDLISGERVCHFFVHPPYGDFPLRCVSLHFFVLGKFDRAGSLVFRRLACGQFVIEKSRGSGPSYELLLHN